MSKDEYVYRTWNRSFKLCIAMYQLGIEFPNSAKLESYWKERIYGAK
jgi:hypothetical protein